MLLARIATHITLAKTNIAYGRFVPHEFIQLLGKQNVVWRCGRRPERRGWTMGRWSATWRSASTSGSSRCPRTGPAAWSLA